MADATRTKTIPISALSPSYPSGASIRAIVSLVWPYSSSNKSLALLLAESDFRLRKRKGQVSVIFRGPAAKAVAESRVKIGDEVLLRLEGAQWKEEEDEVIGGVHTPGKSVGWVLEFRRRAVVQVRRAKEVIARVDVDAADAESDAEDDPRKVIENGQVDIAPTTPTFVAQVPRLRAGLRDSWDSPAFLKHGRLSNGTSQSATLDPFLAEAEEDGYIPGKGRKRPRVSWGERSSLWRFVDRTPSPEKEQTGEEDVLDHDQSGDTKALSVPTTALPRTPVSALGAEQQDDQDDDDDQTSVDTVHEPRAYTLPTPAAILAQEILSSPLQQEVASRMQAEHATEYPARHYADGRLNGLANPVQYAQAALNDEFEMSATELATEDESEAVESDEEDQEQVAAQRADCNEGNDSSTESYTSEGSAEREVVYIEGEEGEDEEGDVDEDAEELADYGEEESEEETDEDEPEEYSRAGVPWRQYGQEAQVPAEPRPRSVPEVIVLSDTEEDEPEREAAESESDIQDEEVDEIQPSTDRVADMTETEEDEVDGMDEQIEEEVVSEEESVEDSAEDVKDADGAVVVESEEEESQEEAIGGEEIQPEDGQGDQPEQGSSEANVTASEYPTRGQDLSELFQPGQTMAPPPPRPSIRIDPRILEAPSTPELRPQTNSSLPLPSPFPDDNNSAQGYMDRQYVGLGTYQGIEQTYSSMESTQPASDYNFEQTYQATSSEILQAAFGNNATSSFGHNNDNLHFGLDGSGWSMPPRFPDVASNMQQNLSSHQNTSSQQPQSEAVSWEAQGHEPIQPGTQVHEQTWQANFHHHTIPVETLSTEPKHVELDEDMQWIRSSPLLEEDSAEPQQTQQEPDTSEQLHSIAETQEFEQEKPPSGLRQQETDLPISPTESQSPEQVLDREKAVEDNETIRVVPQQSSSTSAAEGKAELDDDCNQQASAQLSGEQNEQHSMRERSPTHPEQQSGSLEYPGLHKSAEPTPALDTDAVRFTWGVPVAVSNETAKDPKWEKNPEMEEVHTQDASANERAVPAIMGKTRATRKRSIVNQDDLAALKQLAAAEPDKERISVDQEDIAALKQLAASKPQDQQTIVDQDDLAALKKPDANKPDDEETMVDQDDLAALKQLAAAAEQEGASESNVKYPALPEANTNFKPTEPRPQFTGRITRSRRQQATPDASQQTTVSSPDRGTTIDVKPHSLPTPQATQISVSMVESTQKVASPEAKAKSASTTPQTTRVTRSSKLKAAAPAVIEEYFTRSKRQSLTATKEEPASPAKIQFSNRGLRTSLGYYTPLLNLPAHLNSPSATIDVIAVVTKASTKPQRAPSGPKDWFTSFNIVDPSNAAGAIVRCFRPWKAALPIVEVGDVVLLHKFVVKSSKNKMTLIDGEEAAWCCWRFSEKGDSVEKAFEEIRGPPVEIGSEERKHVDKLRHWWRAQDNEKSSIG